MWYKEDLCLSLIKYLIKYCSCQILCMVKNKNLLNTVHASAWSLFPSKLGNFWRGWGKLLKGMEKPVRMGEGVVVL